MGRFSGLLLIVCSSVSAAEPVDDPHVIRDIEGWTVHVDPSLLDGEHKPLGDKALKILAAELFEVTLLVPESRVKELRKVPIWIDREHALGSCQYHPNIGWLKNNGHNPKMAKAVHIPRAKRLINLQRPAGQPAVLLHELAHAYHDRVLSFDHPGIKATYDAAVERGDYESVLHISGKKNRHYALTNHKEFFAEMTEAYFCTNDFYPFVQGELRTTDPETFHLLKSVWGDAK